MHPPPLPTEKAAYTPANCALHTGNCFLDSRFCGSKPEPVTEIVLTFVLKFGKFRALAFSISSAAARVVTRTRKYEHITPVLIGLHWLPISYRITFKILLLTYKALNNLAPSYLSDLLSQRCNVRLLRSHSQELLSIPRSRTVTSMMVIGYFQLLAQGSGMSYLLHYARPPI